MEFEALSQLPLNIDSEPPFEEVYKSLLVLEKDSTELQLSDVLEECQLPLIDLSRLHGGSDAEKEECKREIARASVEWGFFQVVNHGISQEVLERMRHEQVKLFRQPFEKKAGNGTGNHEGGNVSGLLGDSYRWGTPTATCLKQLCWTEAFHIPLTNVSMSDQTSSLSFSIKEYGTKVSSLAHIIAEILAENLGLKSTFFTENFFPSTCYLRMNRYPPCPLPFTVFGMMPHTDSDFLTILHQDQVGGLQLVKDGRWVTVKPNPEALIINIGDLFQAWSSDIYKCLKHRVMTNRCLERFSVAYFFCPSYDTIIQCSKEPSVYRKFSFKEYRQQVQEDVRTTGSKIGLPRFLL